MEASQQELVRELKQLARMLGFTSVGVCPAVQPTGISRFRQWLASGYAGEMRYLADRAPAYEHPRHVLDGVRSLVMLSINYRTHPPRPTADGHAKVSQYAWGNADYHDLLHKRLGHLSAWLTRRCPGCRVRGVVDTAPLLEREFAQLAGLGWIGKNTMLINQQAGSWLLLAALLTDVELAYDRPFQTDHCGRCRACLDACPTDAFPRPYVLDATRCISYLTIELRGSIPHALRGTLGDWVFGCDICQEVCPWNRRAPQSTEPTFQPLASTNPLKLAGLFELDDTVFRQQFRQTALWRAKRRGLLRNAAIVLGNQRSGTACRPLCRGLNDAEPLVRAACAWALGLCPHPSAVDALRARMGQESDPEVRGEITAALGRLGAG